MAKITQYQKIVSGFKYEAVVAEFSSIDELFKIPFVKNFKFNPVAILSNFINFLMMNTP